MLTTTLSPALIAEIAAIAMVLTSMALPAPTFPVYLTARR